jgi:hypothetical protein
MLLSVYRKLSPTGAIRSIMETGVIRLEVLA